MSTAMQVTNELISSLDANLSKALAKLREQREAYEQEIEQLRFRESLVEQALDGLDGSLPRPQRRTLNISEEKLAAVKDYVATEGSVRQVKIGEALKLNSGTVSVALRIMLKERLVEKGELDKGSRVWHSTARQRETRVKPGEGVTSGRLVA